MRKLLTLIKINIKYYIMKKKDLSKRSERYKGVLTETCVSISTKEKTPQELVQYLTEFDIISFDVFDTMVFRPFFKPTDLFPYVGDKLGYNNFKPLRIKMEIRARKQKYVKKGTSEVTLEEIYDLIEEEVRIPKQTGMNAEIECEKKYCFANPYMMQVIDELQKRGKTMILTSDMYLKSQVIQDILYNCGYGEFFRYYVSCEYQKSKAGGKLYEQIMKELGKNKEFVHIGDNKYSDQWQAARYGWAVCAYNNTNEAERRI